MFPSSGFNEYAAGSKVYNGGSSAPTGVRVSNQLGMAERKLATGTRRNALLRRLKAGQSGQLMNADWLRGPRA